MNEENKFPCVFCGTKLESKELLQEHFRKHANKEIDTKGKPVKAVKQVTEGKDNNKSPTKSNKITCDICEMEFETVTQGIQHKFRRHPETSAKHFCSFCGMQFPLKFTRDKHVESHKGMSTFGTFPCSECGVVFYNAQAQNYHFKSNHKRIMSIFKPVPTPPPSKKIKINNANEAQSVYYCYLCGMEYIVKFNLQKHLERSHAEEERNKIPEDLIKCITCDALFYNKKAYENHNLYHKPDDLYVTSEEQRLQTVTRVDQDFDIRRVQLVTDKFIPVDKPKIRRQNNNKVQMKVEKPPTDDELSPTSSIEDSDEEKDDKQSKATKIETSIKVETNETAINSKTVETNEVAINSKTVETNEETINPKTETNESAINPKTVETIEAAINTKTVETNEAAINRKIVEEKEDPVQTKAGKKQTKTNPQKRKSKLSQSTPTKRSLRSNTNIT